MEHNIEVTDTFCGEPNYAWVRRYHLSCKGLTDRQIIRRAKKLAGWTGIRCTIESYGDSWALRPRNGACVVMFITWAE